MDLNSTDSICLGRPFVVRADHSSLQWLRRTPEPIAQQARWLAFIEQFRYTIEDRPGNRHTNADALSQRPSPCRQCSQYDNVLDEPNNYEDETEVKSKEDETSVSTVVRSI